MVQSIEPESSWSLIYSCCQCLSPSQLLCEI